MAEFSKPISGGSISDILSVLYLWLSPERLSSVPNGGGRTPDAGTACLPRRRRVLSPLVTTGC